jgi:TRAP-type C4-dicarboxylate transport system permease small subunit
MLKKEFFNNVEKYIKLINLFLFCVLGLLMFSQIIARYIFKSPFTWSDELARYIFIYIVWLNCVLVTKNNLNISLYVFYNRLKESYKRRVAFIMDLIIILFFSVVLFGGWKMMVLNKTFRTPDLNIPRMYIYLPVTLSAFLLILYKSLNLYITFNRGISKKSKEIYKKHHFEKN